MTQSRKNIHKKRVRHLWDLVGDMCSGVLITSPENVRYLCGFSGTEGTLLVGRGESVFLTDGRYTTQAKAQVQGASVVTFTEKYKKAAGVLRDLRITDAAYESRTVTVDCLQRFEAAAPKVRFIACCEPLDMLREIKDAGEIAILRDAARIAAESLDETLPFVVPGARETDIAARLEYAMRIRGADGIAFQTIVASGPRSALPHGVASDRTLEKGDLVTIDYGLQYRGYCSDETCTFVLGRPTKKQQRIYETVLAAHDRAIKAVKPGASLASIDKRARSHIEKQGFKKYFSHGTGHGLGLCVHEPPVVSWRSTARAREGMVFTIEPGIYLPGWGGVRIEDTVAVTPGGAERITRSDKKLRPLPA